MHTCFKRHVATLLCALGATLFAGSCLAGRPLSVDDANVDDVSTGHVETWYGRQSGHSNNWTAAPAYAVASGVEIDGLVSRDSSAAVNSGAVQIKLRLTESRSDGCNFAGTLGLSRASGDPTSTPYLNAIATCNMHGGAVHLNLGAQHAASNATIRTWGVAYERELGAITGHVEYFGQQQARPTAQVGLRSEVVKNIQLDGTLGRSGRDTVCSLGMKFMF